jgi:ferredoxin
LHLKNIEAMQMTSILAKTLLRSSTKLVMKNSFISISRSFSYNNDVKFTFFEEGSGNHVEVTAPLGKTLLDVALENNIDIEGACGGELACSTCHVIVSKELFDKLPAKQEEEDDMLDLAWGLTDT